jgi:hypothetical protein
MLALSVPGGEVFGRINDYHDSFASSSNLPLKSSEDIFVLLAKQELSPGKTSLKGRNQMFRLWRIAAFAFFVILLLAALSRAFIIICNLKSKEFYTYKS